MGSIDQIQKELEALGTKMRNSVKNTLHEESISLLSDFKDHSPEDTGAYKSHWFVGKSRSIGSGSVTNVVFRNTDIKAPLMEFGGAKKEAPWFYPGHGKKTGKLVVRHGRVWAGGLNPGFSKTIGGAINKVLYNNTRRQLKIAKKIATDIIKVIM